MTTDNTIDAAAAAFDEIQRERERERELTLDELLDRREAARAQREQAEQAEREWKALAAGGPCAYCGMATSAGRDSSERENATGEVRPWWRSTPLGPVCIVCEFDDRSPLGHTVDDVTHRGAVAIALLGLERQWQPTQLGKRIKDVFRWWAELTPRPAQPTCEAERFSYVDREALRSAIAAPTPYLREGPACPHCGTADAWHFEPAGLEAVRFGDAMRNMPTPPGDRCTACGYFRQDPGYRGTPSEEVAALSGTNWSPLNPDYVPDPLHGAR